MAAGCTKIEPQIYCKYQSMGKSSFLIIFALTVFTLKSASQLSLPPHPGSLPDVKKFQVLPQNFYTNNLGFFCKKEDQLQKRTGINLFVRLGTKNYVDYLEQKPNATKSY
jgi:hypothetical protein